jgi:hypothetical protein
MGSMAKGQVRASLWEFVAAVFRYWWTFVIGGVFGAAGTVSLLSESPEIPDWIRDRAWLWFAIAGLSLLVAAFQAFHKVRIERDKAIEERNEAKQQSGPSVLRFGDAAQRISVLNNLIIQDLAAPRPQQTVPVPSIGDAVHLADLIDIDDPTIRGQMFEDQRFVGPAVLLPGKGLRLEGNEFVVATEADLLCVMTEPWKLAGIIGLEDTIFLRCHFYGIGFAVTYELKALMERNFREGE